MQAMIVANGRFKRTSITCASLCAAQILQSGGGVCSTEDLVRNPVYVQWVHGARSKKRLLPFALFLSSIRLTSLYSPHSTIFFSLPLWHFSNAAIMLAHSGMPSSKACVLFVTLALLWYNGVDVIPGSLDESSPSADQLSTDLSITDIFEGAYY